LPSKKTKNLFSRLVIVAFFLFNRRIKGGQNINLRFLPSTNNRKNSIGFIILFLILKNIFGCCNLTAIKDDKQLYLFKELF